jgi:hypothetical protein
VCLWLFTSVIFLLSPVLQVEDSRFSLLVSESLLHRHTFDLSPNLPPFVTVMVTDQLEILSNVQYYQLLRVNRTIVYAYPPGGSILSIPLVALLNLSGLSASSNHRFNFDAEDAMQRIIAAFLMAALISIFFRAARLLLPLRWSILIALGAAFGTPVWSSLSRALWGQTWAVFLTGYLVYRLLEDSTSVRPLSGTIAATLASWIFFTRPTGAIVIIGVTVYLAVCRKQLLVPWLAAGTFWLICFVVFSFIVYRTLLPPYYYAHFLHPRYILEATIGILFSPSRGLFIFIPMTLWVLFLLMRNRGSIRYRALTSLAVGVSLGHLLLIASDIQWWGGFCYGPRLMSDLIPWLVLLAIIACDAEMHRRPSRFVPPGMPILSMSRWIKALGLLALVISIFMNGAGALSKDTLLWNVRDVNVDKHPEKIWDWKRPQFLAWARGAPVEKPDRQ